MEDTRTSILQMARGAIMERIDYEMTKVVDNILDPNTEATAKRKVQLTRLQPADRIGCLRREKRSLPDKSGCDVALYHRK